MEKLKIECTDDNQNPNHLKNSALLTSGLSSSPRREVHYPFITTDLSSSYSSMDTYYTDRSPDKASPCSSSKSIQLPAKHLDVFNDVSGKMRSHSQTEMEAFKLRSLKKSAYSSHNSSLSSIDVSDLQQPQPHVPQLYQLRSYDDDDDDDVLKLNFNSPVLGVSSEMTSPSPKARVRHDTNLKDDCHDNLSKTGGQSSWYCRGKLTASVMPRVVLPSSMNLWQTISLAHVPRQRWKDSKQSAEKCLLVIPVIILANLASM